MGLLVALWKVDVKMLGKVFAIACRECAYKVWEIDKNMKRPVIAPPWGWFEENEVAFLPRPSKNVRAKFDGKCPLCSWFKQFCAIEAYLARPLEPLRHHGAMLGDDNNAVYIGNVWKTTTYSHGSDWPSNQARETGIPRKDRFNMGGPLHDPKTWFVGVEELLSSLKLPPLCMLGVVVFTIASSRLKPTRFSPPVEWETTCECLQQPSRNFSQG